MVTIQEKDDVVMEASSGGDGGCGGVETAAVREVPSTQPKHIRPTVRGKAKTKSTGISSSASSDNNSGKTTNSSDGNAMVEETRIKMDSWMGLKGRTKQQQPTTTTATATAEEDAVQHGQPLSKKTQNETKSILKKPKYSSKPMETVGIPSSAGGGGAAAASSGTFKEKRNKDDDRGSQDGSSSTNFAAASGGSAICKSFVVERDPSIAPLKKKRSGTKARTDNNTTTSVTIKTNDLVGNNQRHNSIEGYVPSSSNPTGASSSAAAGTSAAACYVGAKGTETGTVTDAGGQQASAETDGADGDASKEGETDDPLILNSLAELFVAAQDETSYVPPDNPHKIDENTQLLEADISFKVMSQKDFVEQKPIIEEQAETEHIQNIQRFIGRSDVFGDDGVDDDGNSENDSSLANTRDDDDHDGGDDDEIDDDDEALMEILMTVDDPGEDDDDGDENDMIEYSPEDDNLPDRQPRSFILLWRAITEWMTPQTVQWFVSLQSNSQLANQKRDLDGGGDDVMKIESDVNMDVDTNWTPIVDQSDIGASRCAGVMAMLRLHLSGCLDELHRPIEMRRKVEKRLADLLRTFDYTRQNPHLHVDQWKALTCIFLEMILSNEDVDSGLEIDGSSLRVPQSVVAVGITEDEYRYLSKSSLATFGTSTS